MLPMMTLAQAQGEKITITNDRGRLAEDRIEKMIKEAEQPAGRDEKVKQRADEKNDQSKHRNPMNSESLKKMEKTIAVKQNNLARLKELGGDVDFIAMRTDITVLKEKLRQEQGVGDLKTAGEAEQLKKDLQEMSENRSE